MRRNPAIPAVMLVVALLPRVAGAEERGIPRCMGEAATIVGSDASETLMGTPGDDVIVGRGGDDSIYGKGGSDLICGGAGDDEVFGGDGDDTLLGGIGADALFGAAGEDILKGGGGNDRLDGGGDDDTLAGWFGADRLLGGHGDDRLSGHLGDDVIEGGTGDDVAWGGGGSDEIDGGAGTDRCIAEIVVACEFEALAPGDDGPAVELLQQMLSEKYLYRGPIDGEYGEKLSEAVIAFHKVVGEPRVNRWKSGDWARLEDFTPKPPKNRTGRPDRLEVDVGHQVMYLVEDDEVAAIFAVSTGGEYVYWSKRMQDWVVAHTPRGSFTLLRHTNGWSCDSLYGWCIYKPWSFTSAYALHGYPSVPSYPASHGCVRVHTWESDWLDGHLTLGMPIYVWD